MYILKQGVTGVTAIDGVTCLSCCGNIDWETVYDTERTLLPEAKAVCNMDNVTQYVLARPCLQGCYIYFSQCMFL